MVADDAVGGKFMGGLSAGILYVRARLPKLAGLIGVLMLCTLGEPATAATVIVVQPDGSVVVRPEAGEPVVIPEACAARLSEGLPGLADSDAVQALVAEVVADCAPDDGRLAGAIAAYALTLVPEELSVAVVAGAQQGNPDASEEIIVAAGPAPDTQEGGGLANLTSVGGVGGGGTQELIRSASEVQ